MADVAALEFVGPSSLVHNLFFTLATSSPPRAHSFHLLILTDFIGDLGIHFSLGSYTLTPGTPQRLLVKLLNFL